MMWLGIVLHVAVNPLERPSPMPWRDPVTTRVADLLVTWILAFRMPVFFIVAGFFAALLLERRSAGGLLRHRLRRIALQFVLLGPPLVAAGLAFAHRSLRRSRGGCPTAATQVGRTSAPWLPAVGRLTAVSSQAHVGRAVLSLRSRQPCGRRRRATGPDRWRRPGARPRRPCDR